MNKLKIAVILVVISVILACGSSKHRYDRCPTFSLKAKKTVSVNAGI
jgi:hypothetical protein